MKTKQGMGNSAPVIWIILGIVVLCLLICISIFLYRKERAAAKQAERELAEAQRESATTTPDCGTKEDFFVTPKI